ncbi:hypothetical protein T01_6205 [Trichinella spiralis]|uniref:Uncharacterized protein n=1 Tax=Trichinella spiralis TaxID=6334 RepID=A0A0V1AVT6_TRISP|nr:hypothetical protein T01_6205 [Trichinella spiralis]
MKKKKKKKQNFNETSILACGSFSLRQTWPTSVKGRPANANTLAAVCLIYTWIAEQRVGYNQMQSTLTVVSSHLTDEMPTTWTNAHTVPVKWLFNFLS